MRMTPYSSNIRISSRRIGKIGMKFNFQEDSRGLDGEEGSYERTKQNKQTNKNKGMKGNREKTCKQNIPMIS